MNQITMSQSDKSRPASKQKRPAAPIEPKHEKQSVRPKTAAASRATSNKINKNIAMSTLTTGQIDQHMKDFPGWAHHQPAITRTYKFESFLMSIAFVRRIAKRAEKIQHHPDIDIRFDRVKLTLSTHDAGGITEIDFTLARECDEVFAKFAEE